MSKFNLNVFFTPDQIRKFFACGSNLVIAKSSHGEGLPNVAWLSIKPMENTTIKWEEKCGIYASTTALQKSAVIEKMTSLPSIGAGSKYVLNPSGTFDPQLKNEHPHAYAVHNNYRNSERGYLTMGLTQDVNVNGDDYTGNVISAVSVPFENNIQMTTSTTVYLWIAANFSNGSVISDVTSPITKVVFTDESSVASLNYNSNNGKFNPL